jgi:hypothetical protein
MSYVSFSGIESADEKPRWYLVVDADDADCECPVFFRVPGNREASDKSKNFPHDYAFNEQQAAEMWAEYYWSEFECPEQMECIVTDPEGKKWRCEVYIELTPSCTAYSEAM